MAVFVKPSVSYRERAILHAACRQGPWAGKASGATKFDRRGDPQLQKGPQRGLARRPWQRPGRTSDGRARPEYARAVLNVQALKEGAVRSWCSMPSTGAPRSAQQFFTATAVPARQRHAAARLAGLHYVRRWPCAPYVARFFGADRAAARHTSGNVGAVQGRARRQRVATAEAGSGTTRCVVASVFAQPALTRRQW